MFPPLGETLSNIAHMSGEGGHTPPVSLLAPPQSQPCCQPAPALTRHREQRQDIVIVYT